MKPGLVNLLLIAIALVGGFCTWQTSRTERRLRTEFERLSLLTGEFPVADSSKVYLRAIETGEPMHFAWRVYVPPGYRQVTTDNLGSKGESYSSSSDEFIVRIRFRENEQGVLEAFARRWGGGGWELGNQDLAKLLQDRWEKIQVMQLGSDGVVTLEPTDSAVLLRLTMPDDIQVEARKLLSPKLQELYVPVLYELALGSKTSHP